MGEDDLRKIIELYSNPTNVGEAELYGNPNAMGAAFGHTQFAPEGLLNAGVGVDYFPQSEVKVDPFAFARMQTNNGLDISGSISKTQQMLDIAKGNVGVGATRTPEGTGINANVFGKIMGGDYNVEAYKNPYDKGIFGNITWGF